MMRRLRLRDTENRALREMNVERCLTARQVSRLLELLYKDSVAFAIMLHLYTTFGFEARDEMCTLKFWFVGSQVVKELVA